MGEKAEESAVTLHLIGGKGKKKENRDCAVDGERGGTWMGSDESRRGLEFRNMGW